MSDMVPRSEVDDPKQLSSYRLQSAPPHVSIVEPRRVPSVAPSRPWYPMVASIVFLFAVTGIQFLVPSAHHVMSLVGTGALVGLFAVVALAMLWPDLSGMIKQRTSHMRQARGSRQAGQPPQQERSAKQVMRDRAA